MDAAPLAGDAPELHHFVEGRVVAGNVEETGAQTERAVTHPVPDEVAHALQFVGGRRTIHLSDHRAAHGPVTDEGADVDRRPRGLHLGQVRADLHRAAAVGARDDRRHPLPHVVLGRRVADDVLTVPAFLRMRVDVDEPGRDDEPARVDDSGAARLEPRRDRGNRVALDADVRAEPGISRPVDDSSTAHDQIERPALRFRPRLPDHQRRANDESQQDAAKSAHVCVLSRCGRFRS